MESKLYKSGPLSKLQPTQMTAYYEEGDERPSHLTVGGGPDPDRWREVVELQDLWLPMEGLLVTIPVEEQEGDWKPLRIVEWNGPERGPYRKLWHTSVPGQLMPLPPADAWQDLHELANSLMRKLANQAERQKTIGIFTDRGDNAQRINETADGEWARSDDPTSAKEVSLGGVSQTNFGFLNFVLQQFSYQAGNLDTLGGLSPQADTLGQEKLLSTSASVRMQSMQKTVTRETKKVLSDLYWYMWTDPLIDMPLVKRVPESDIEIPTRFRAGDLEGDYGQYNLDIVPYSMQGRSPAERLQTLTAIFQQFLMPLAGQLAQQGGQIDFAALIKKIGKLSNMEADLVDIIKFGDPPEEPVDPGGGGYGDGAGKPAVTSRTYERVNRPGATRQGAQQALTSQLMGGNLQPAEQAAINRPPS